MDRKLEDEIRRTLDERAQYFTPRWFGRLFRAELGLADTFWTGMFGILLVIVPVIFIFTSTMKVVAPALAMPAMSALTLALGLYWAAVTRAVIPTARRSPQSRGWAKAAIVVAVLMTLSAIIGGLSGLL